MWGWEVGTIGESVEAGEHDYAEEDRLAQAAFTTAAVNLIGGATTHPSELDRSLEQFDVVLASYVSALEHRFVEFP